MTDKEQQLLTALRKIESMLWWHDNAGLSDMRYRICDARAVARDAISEHIKE